MKNINMKKKKLTGENNDLKTEIRHLGVIVEHTNDKVSLLAEQYGGIKKDIGNIKKDVSNIKNTVDSHTEILNSHTEMIGRLNVDVTIIKEDVEFIKNSLKKKIDVEEFAALERRVTLLEKRNSRI